MYSQHVASSGLADDVLLVSDDLFFLKNILSISLQYCKKYHVSLAADKTRLVAFYAKKDLKIININSLDLISINGSVLQFSSSAEHVGVLRSCEGNLPHLAGRIAARKRALFALLPAGLALKNNANIAAVLYVDKVFSVPVMFSGLNSLVLSKSKTEILSKSH